METLSQSNKYKILGDLEEFIGKVNNSADAEFKILIPKIKSYISSNNALDAKCLEKTKEFKSYINTKEYKNITSVLANIIQDASYELYKSNLPNVWFPQSMYTNFLSKNEFVNKIYGVDTDTTFLAVRAYEFYNALLKNNPDTNSKLFTNNGLSQFLMLNLTALLIKSKYNCDNFDYLIDKFQKIINTATDFHNFSVSELFTFDELWIDFIIFSLRISYRSVLNELKIFVLSQQAEPESQEQIEEGKTKIQFKIDGTVEINGKTTIKENGKEKPIISENNKKILKELVDRVGEYLTEWEIRDISWENIDCIASNNLRVAICQLNNLLNNAIDTQKGNKRTKTYAKYRLNKDKVEIIKK